MIQPETLQVSKRRQRRELLEAGTYSLPRPLRLSFTAADFLGILFFPKLQRANSHKRTLPCLKATNSWLQSMCCLEFLKQSHTLAAKLLLGRATCQSWQLLLLKGKCVGRRLFPSTDCLLLRVRNLMGFQGCISQGQKGPGGTLR